MSLQRYPARWIAEQWHGTDLWDDVYVREADHLAAVEAVRQACIAAVEAMGRERGTKHTPIPPTFALVIAALREVQP